MVFNATQFGSTCTKGFGADKLGIHPVSDKAKFINGDDLIHSINEAKNGGNRFLIIKHQERVRRRKTAVFPQHETATSYRIGSITLGSTFLRISSRVESVFKSYIA